MVIQTKNGYPEVILMAPCQITVFHKTAEWLRQKMNIHFSSKEEKAEQICWQFQFAGVTCLLQYDRQTGVSLFPASLSHCTPEESAAFEKFAETLQYSSPG